MLCVRALCFLVFCGLIANLQGLNSTERNVTETPQESKKVESIRQTWIKTDKNLKAFMSKFIRSSLPTLMREVYTRNVSTSCMSGLMQFSNGLKKTKLWAFEMFDASGKLPEGFLSGTLTTLGNYGECLKIKVNVTKKLLRGQYCRIEVTPPLPDWRPFTSFHYPVPELANLTSPDTVIGRLTEFVHNLHITSLKTSVCVPSLCTEDDVQKLIQIIPDWSGLNWKFQVMHCEIEQEIVFTPHQQAILSAFGVIAFFLACGFVLDIFLCESIEPRSGTKCYTAVNILKCFSPIRNSRKLAAYVCPEEDLKFVHGLMFYFLFWIIISNNFMYFNYDVSSNFIEALSVIQNIFYEILLNRTMPIQSFFFLSGLVTAYRVTKSKEDFCIWKYVFKKYWRYTLTYMLVMSLMMLAPVWGAGPSWHDHLMPIYEKCLSNWWANLLYINNFLKPENSCLDHTWLFAVDAQLHLIGILILLPLKKKPKIGLFVNFFLLGVSLLTVALTNVYYQMPPTELNAFLHKKDRDSFAEHTYTRTYTHLCMYCSGIAVGYFMAIKPKLKIYKTLVGVLWIATVFGGLYTMCAIHDWRKGDLPSPTLGALYAALGKLAWAGLLSWIAIACITGNGGPVKDFLSWRPFSFFGRLCFIAYLVNPVILQVVMGFRKSHQYVEQFEFLYPLLSHLSAIYFFAYLCHLAFEAPLMTMGCVLRGNTMCRFFTTSKPSIKTTSNGVLTEKPMKYASKHTDKSLQTDRSNC